LGQLAQADRQRPQLARRQVLLAELHQVNAAVERGRHDRIQRAALRRVPVGDQRQAGNGQLRPRWRLRAVHRTTPSSGLLAEAYAFFGMRPARYAMRPAWSPSAMAFAIAGGSSASATAVFTRQASAPISIASAASDGAPMPESTTTGTRACSTMMRIWSKFTMPCPEPMGEASGMTVAVPTSSSRLARTGSSLM